MGLRSLLRFIGKGERKVIAVFGFDPSRCHAAVLHVRNGAPGLPILLFATVKPLPETAALCEHVEVSRSTVRLLFRAERRLWRDWVAIGVAPWTGGHGRWPMKLAPFLIPPFRALLLNENGDFVPGSPPNILTHLRRRVWDAGHTGLYLGGAYWKLVWRSSAIERRREQVAVSALLPMAFVWRAALKAMQWRSVPRQSWFERLHGREPLRLSPAQVAGRGVANFYQRGPHWNSRKFAEFADSCNSRHIVWRQEALSVGRVEEMRRMFDDERTFAVSTQTHFGGGKPTLFPLAPFRTLQPGEASRVLAPLSGEVMVDRAKLLALGIPRCALTETAWMILFWKAAAAGWRSYSLGQPRELGEQPDFPRQEAAFLVRLLFQGALRRLGPCEPALARGSIAFAPSAVSQPAKSDRLTVLAIAPFLPDRLSPREAGRLFHLSRALADRVDFVLIAMREAHDVVRYEPLHEVFRSVYIVDQDEAALRALVAEVAREWSPDVLQIETADLAGLCDVAPQTPVLPMDHGGFGPGEEGFDWSAIADVTYQRYRALIQARAISPR